MKTEAELPSKMLCSVKNRGDGQSSKEEDYFDRLIG
jgi:hypothetical protein